MFALLALVILQGSSATAAPSENVANGYQPGPGKYPVQVLRYDWFDIHRNRKVPVKIYYPGTGDGPFPIVIFSHGLGGSREGYEYLGQYWASHGYVSVHVQHLGSDSAVWENVPMNDAMAALRKAAAIIANVTNRPLDISFTIDRLEELDHENSPLKGKLDLNRIGVAGHSFGAFTTLAVAGEVFVSPTGREVSFADSRVKAAIAMSSPVPVNKSALDQAFGKIKIPCLHMTGTEDSSPIGHTSPADRRLPYEHIHGSNQFLIIFRGANHGVFSGRPDTAVGTQLLDAIHTLICQSSTAFWDAYLKQNSAAFDWLAHGGFKNDLGKRGTFEEQMVSR